MAKTFSPFIEKLRSSFLKNRCTSVLRVEEFLSKRCSPRIKFPIIFYCNKNFTMSKVQLKNISPYIQKFRIFLLGKRRYPPLKMEEFFPLRSLYSSEVSGNIFQEIRPDYYNTKRKRDDIRIPARKRRNRLSAYRQCIHAESSNKPEILFGKTTSKTTPLPSLEKADNPFCENTLAEKCKSLNLQYKSNVFRLTEREAQQNYMNVCDDCKLLESEYDKNLLEQHVPQFSYSSQKTIDSLAKVNRNKKASRKTREDINAQGDSADVCEDLKLENQLLTNKTDYNLLKKSSQKISNSAHKADDSILKINKETNHIKTNSKIDTQNGEMAIFGDFNTVFPIKTIEKYKRLNKETYNNSLQGHSGRIRRLEKEKQSLTPENNVTKSLKEGDEINKIQKKLLNICDDSEYSPLKKYQKSKDSEKSNNCSPMETNSQRSDTSRSSKKVLANLSNDQNHNFGFGDKIKAQENFMDSNDTNHNSIVNIQENEFLEMRKDSNSLEQNTVKCLNTFNDTKDSMTRIYEAETSYSKKRDRISAKENLKDAFERQITPAEDIQEGKHAGKTNFCSLFIENSQQISKSLHDRENLSMKTDKNRVHSSKSNDKMYTKENTTDKHETSNNIITTKKIRKNILGKNSDCNSMKESTYQISNATENTKELLTKVIEEGKHSSKTRDKINAYYKYLLQREMPDTCNSLLQDVQGNITENKEYLGSKPGSIDTNLPSKRKRVNITNSKKIKESLQMTRDNRTISITNPENSRSLTVTASDNLSDNIGNPLQAIVEDKQLPFNDLETIFPKKRKLESFKENLHSIKAKTETKPVGKICQTSEIKKLDRINFNPKSVKYSLGDFGEDKISSKKMEIKVSPTNKKMENDRVMASTKMEGIKVSDTHRISPQTKRNIPKSTNEVEKLIIKSKKMKSSIPEERTKIGTTNKLPKNIEHPPRNTALIGNSPVKYLDKANTLFLPEGKTVYKSKSLPQNKEKIPKKDVLPIESNMDRNTLSLIEGQIADSTKNISDKTSIHLEKSMQNIPNLIDENMKSTLTDSPQGIKEDRTLHMSGIPDKINASTFLEKDKSSISLTQRIMDSLENFFVSANNIPDKTEEEKISANSNQITRYPRDKLSREMMIPYNYPTEINTSCLLEQKEEAKDTTHNYQGVNYLKGKLTEDKLISDGVLENVNASYLMNQKTGDTSISLEDIKHHLKNLANNNLLSGKNEKMQVSYFLRKGMQAASIGLTKKIKDSLSTFTQEKQIPYETSTKEYAYLIENKVYESPVGIYLTPTCDAFTLNPEPHKTIPNWKVYYWDYKLI